ncbi:MAG TPA: RpiB/LacA/LacB family sugar-phosphate isomerase, partial [Rhizomicrobium sp.]|nr:RpiB/LacA/LacB family sugar-phosphate isomerase [Rhizomicrobium sp.]
IGSEETYAALAARVAKSVVDREFDRAVLCCGTGQGVMMVANKVPGIRAGLVNGPYAAERLALSNDAQIVCVGAVDGYGKAQDLNAVEEWVSQYLGLKFDPQGRSAENVAAIDEVDERYRAEPAGGEVEE